MKILILNWRDIKNPQSGGAEILTHEMAKRWVKKGHSVMLFSSSFTGCKKKEYIDGVQIVRDGKPDMRTFFSSVHFKAYRFYRKNLRGKIDIVIDEVHGMPFFSIFYVREPVVPLICEVARDIWGRMFGFPWNKIGALMEKLMILVYRNKIFMTISDSTKKDLIAYGVRSENIVVLPMGINRISVKNVQKQKNPTIIFVARLTKMKGVEDAIVACAYIAKQLKKVQLWIIGRGDMDYVKHLHELISMYNLQKHVSFFDFVTEKNKFELMAKSGIIISPSMREGFGLTIPEAGTVGTPAVVYDVPGLRDVVNKSNGIKVKNKTPEELARKVVSLFSNKKLYNFLRKGAIEESKKYRWESTAETGIGVLERVVAG